MPVEPYPDILKNIRDTLNVIGPQVHQIAEASDPGMARLNLLMAIIAAVAGSLGTVFGFFSYWYSKKTAKNVARTNAKNRLSVNEIVSRHFVNVHFAVEEGRNEIEGIPVLENDTGVMLLERLVHAGSTPALNGSLTGTAAVEERRNLELLLTNSAANKAIALLDAYALNPGKQLALEWLSCAWSIDSAIVENQFMRYYGSSV